MMWTRRPIKIFMATTAVILIAGALWAQFQPQRGFRGGGGGRGFGGGRYNITQTGARNDWEIDERFQHEAFRFARVKYTCWGRSDKWLVDFPESDLNLPHRLRELTSMEVHPESVIVELTDENISDFPFLYLIEPGQMALTDEEVEGLRRYLLNGGFLMVDDFWGEDEWYTFYQNIKRVFPDREPQELPVEHEIFHIVYDLAEKPMIPSIGHFMRGWGSERPDANEAHYRGIFDDKGRMMAIICHNTDLGDGWEEEGVDPNYFKQYSERFAYPLGINIVTYAMTH